MDVFVYDSETWVLVLANISIDFWNMKHYLPPKQRRVAYN